jgi:hypothetical protein
MVLAPARDFALLIKLEEMGGMSRSGDPSDAEVLGCMGLSWWMCRRSMKITARRRTL